MADGATRDRAAVVERLRELLRRPDVAAILLSGPARCGKTTAAVEAVASLASSGFCLSRWDVGAASCAATSIHQQCSQQQRPQRTSRGLDRFVTAQGTTTVLLADDVDAGLAAEHQARQRVLSLLQGLGGGSKAILTTSAADPFKVTSRAAHGVSAERLWAAVGARVAFAEPLTLLTLSPCVSPGNARGHPNRPIKDATEALATTKKKSTAASARDELTVVLLEAAAGDAGSDALASTASELRNLFSHARAPSARPGARA